jgi:DNA (cytosine-5)-methyltransferase 1
MTEKHVAGARRVAAFLREHGVKFEGEFAMVGDFVIFDIGMRMLTPRELFRAQGFPDEYVIDKAWLINPKTGEIKEEKLTKEAQIRMCGNSVCPPLAKAIVQCNVPELGRWGRKEKSRYEKRLAIA